MTPGSVTPGAAAPVKPAISGPEAWTHARLGIKVTGVGHSSGSSYALVGNSLVRVGDMLQTTFEGHSYTFRLANIDWRDHCEWEPVTEPPATNSTSKLLIQ